MGEGQKTIAIIGAGIVGVSTALYLQRAGQNVILIDKSGPAEGASFGNAGLLAAASIVPVTTPGLITKAPKMLFDPSEPLFLKWPYLPRIAPWLLRFIKHANAKDASRIASAWAPLISDTLAAHQILAAGTDAEKYIKPSDYIYLYKNKKAFEKDSFSWQTQRANGYSWAEMDEAAYRAYDPNFASNDCYAARLPNHGFIADPGNYIKTLAKHIEANGGIVRKANAEAVIHENGQVTGLRADGQIIACDAVVVASGAWSKPFAKQLGAALPLETERGYHLELWDPSFTPKAPTMVASGKFVATPMEGRLRLAGIVELGGLEYGPSRAPFELLRKNVARMLPNLKWGDETEWMGFRPTLSDSLPVIGAVPNMQGAYLGFGHQHLGLTAGPKTGQILAQLIMGQKSNMDLSPYAIGRFWGSKSST